MSVEEIKKYKTLLESILTEAQNYDEMFNDVRKLIQNTYKGDYLEKVLKESNKEIADIINRAKAVFKTKDRVIWFLRQWKIGFCFSLSFKDQVDMQIVKRLMDDLAKRGNYKSPVPIQKYHDIFTSTNRYLQNMAHYLSLPIPAIQNYNFGFEPIDSVTAKFRDYEETWKAQAKELIEYDPNDGEMIIKFPDGYFWQNLNREYCRAEGNAMGHCGNTAAHKSGDQVLSLRQFVKRGDKTYVRPSLTFILDRHGFLGEMKGRANKKPESKYHPYIVQLLKQDFVHGIKGGGHAPEQNFSINDLDDDVREELIEEKPDLGTLLDIYNKYGAKSSRFQSALDNKVGGTKFDYQRIEDNTVVVEQWSDFERFVSDIGDEVVDYFAEMYENDDYESLFDDLTLKISNDDIYELIDGLSTESYIRLLRDLGIKPAAPNDAIRYRRSIIDAIEEFRKNEQYLENMEKAINIIVSRDNERIATVKTKILDVIKRYIEVGWNFEVYNVYLEMNEDDPNDKVLLKIGLDDYVGIVSADTDTEDPDEYSYSNYRVQDEGWYSVDWYSTNDNRTEKGLPTEYNRSAKSRSKLNKIIGNIGSLENTSFNVFSGVFAKLSGL